MFKMIKRTILSYHTRVLWEVDA